MRRKIVNNYWFLLIAYLVGAIPTSYLMVHFFLNKDIRTLGSGNSGATNTGRVLGAPGFISVLLIDVLKAYGVLYLAAAWSQHDPFLLLCVAAALLLGNAYSPFINFAGGKGVATSVGVVFFLFAPLMWLTYLALFASFFALFRRVDMAVMGAVACGPVCAIALGLTAVTVHAAGALAVWIWWRHATNIMSIWR
jgi:glycerol-3-phosphate acyltransferase PlsY